MVACNENIELEESQNAGLNEEIVIKTLDFYYKGDHYVSEYSCLNDSIIEIFDSATKNVYFGLGNKSNIITYIRPNGSMEFFEDKDDFKRVAKEEETKVIGLRTLPSASKNGVFILFDDTNFKDRSAVIDGYGINSVTHLKYFKINGQEINFNDKTSSFKLESKYPFDLYFEFWEDDNFRDHCLIVKLPPIGTFQEPNLKNIPVVGTSKSWNDRITSIKLNDVRTVLN